MPIGIIAILLTLAYVKETPSYGAKERVDFGGMVLSALTLFSLIYGLIQKEGHANWGWTNMNILSWLIAAVISFIAFIWVESRVKQPMIDLAMFKSRHLIGTLTVAVALGISLYSFNAFLTVLMQNYLGYTAFQTGLRQLTISIWSLILGPVTGALGNRFAKNKLIGYSLFIGAIGFVVFMNAMVTHLSFNQMWPAMILMGITNGMVNPLLNNAGPFAGHGIAFSTRMSHTPFAAGLQTVVLAAYSAAMRNITLVAAVVLVIAGIAALTLMHGRQRSVDATQ